MFSDSDIAKGFQLNKNKATYIATHFKFIFKQEILKPDLISFFFDESLNGIMQTCWMNVIVH